MDFYQHTLALPKTFANDWFVEFKLTDQARLSIADESRASIKSSAGQGITLGWQVADIEQAWATLHDAGIDLEPIRQHQWNARLFRFHDPEGHRLEIWSAD